MGNVSIDIDKFNYHVTFTFHINRLYEIKYNIHEPYLYDKQYWIDWQNKLLLPCWNDEEDNIILHVSGVHCSDAKELSCKLPRHLFGRSLAAAIDVLLANPNCYHQIEEKKASYPHYLQPLNLPLERLEGYVIDYDNFPGDSLPFPEVTKEQLDQELNEHMSSNPNRNMRYSWLFNNIKIDF